MLKNPTAVAVLNFFTIGLGTFLHGKRPGLGLLAFVGGSLLRYEEVRIGPALTGVLSIHWVLATAGMTLLGIGMALDGWREAKG
ncbi:MAG: hypothetical protein K1X89_11100 [Myxococcaceae bacterium]|nr:hypothetical protein [Myxococcaceae bacterium]